MIVSDLGCFNWRSILLFLPLPWAIGATLSCNLFRRRRWKLFGNSSSATKLFSDAPFLPGQPGRAGAQWHRFQRETRSVLTFLLLFLGIPAHNPGLCSFGFYPLLQFVQLCLGGTSSSHPGLAKILMKEKPAGSVLLAGTHEVALWEAAGERFYSFPFTDVHGILEQEMDMCLPLLSKS